LTVTPRWRRAVLAPEAQRHLRVDVLVGVLCEDALITACERESDRDDLGLGGTFHGNVHLPPLNVYLDRAQ